MLSQEIKGELLDCLKVVQDMLKGNSALGGVQLKSIADIFQAAANICNEALTMQGEVIAKKELINNDKQHEPFLSICIPTYNRVEDLKCSLGAIIREFYSMDNVEILVSDNCSTDETELLMKNVLCSYPRIRYYRHDENIGPARNFISCYQRACGRYVWLISDDDFLLENAGNLVMEMLLTEMPVFAAVNATWSSGTEGYRVFTDKNRFMNSVGIYITFISALIFRRDYIMEIGNFEQYYDMLLPQSMIAVETMRHEGKYVVITQRSMGVSCTQSVPYDVYKVWLEEYSNVLLKAAVAAGFDAELMGNIFYRELKLNILNFVITFRKTSAGESTWDKTIWRRVLRRYPELLPIYDLAVNTPVQELSQVYDKIMMMVFRNIFCYCSSYKNIYFFGKENVITLLAGVLSSNDVHIAGQYTDWSVENLQKFACNDFNKNEDAVIIALPQGCRVDLEDVLMEYYGENYYWQDVLEVYMP